MPYSETHKKKFRKNLMVGGMILLWIVLIWAVTMIRIARADEGAHADLYGQRRLSHRETVAARAGQWQNAYAETQAARTDTLDKAESRRANYTETLTAVPERWSENWAAHVTERLAAEEAARERTLSHLEMLDSRPSGWWDAWTETQENLPGQAP